MAAVESLALLLHAEEGEKVLLGAGGEYLGLDALEVVDDDSVEVVPTVLYEVVKEAALSEKGLPSTRGG